jgi:hypothetical protein
MLAAFAVVVAALAVGPGDVPAQLQPQTFLLANPAFARALLGEAPEPERGSAAWTVDGTIAGAVTGGAILGIVGIALGESGTASSSTARQQRAAEVGGLAGLLLGSVGGGLGGWLLGSEAREGKTWAKVAVIALDVVGVAALALFADIFVFTAVDPYAL